MIVRARHAAPYRHVPKGGRHERLDILSVEADAEIPELRESEFPSLGLLEHDPDVRIRHRLPWERLTFSTLSSDHRRPLGRNEFLAWLSGGRTVMDAAFDERFRRTPLVAAVTSMTKSGFIEHGIVRGTDRAPRSRDVVWDGRERAAAAAAAFLRDEVALVGDGVMVRCHPVADVSGGRGRATLMVNISPHTDKTVSAHAPLSRYRDRFPGWRVDVPDASAALLAAVEPTGFDDACTSYLANALPAQVLATIASSHLGDARIAVRFGDVEARLRPFADAAAVGLLGPGEWHAALDLARQGVQRILDVNVRTDMSVWTTIAAHLRSGLLDGPAPSPEDEAAMAGLAP